MIPRSRFSLDSISQLLLYMLKHWKGSVLICKRIKTQQSWPQFFLIALEMKNSQRNFSLRMYKYIISYIGQKVKFRKPINIEVFKIIIILDFYHFLEVNEISSSL